MSVLAKDTATVRLGRGLEESQMLHEQAMQKAYKVLLDFRKTLEQYKPKSIRICGTEALRQAGNSHLFLHNAAEIIGHEIEIISGAEEAGLSLAGALSGFKEPPAGLLLLVDVGGGSTELVVAECPAGETRIKSIPLGVVGVTEKFIAAPLPDPARLDSLLAETLHPSFKSLMLLQKKRPFPVIGCGGTATSMAALDLNLNSYNESLVHGHVLQSASIKKLWDKLIVLPAHKRNALPCLGEGRGEVLPAGIRIYHVLLQLLGQEEMMVSDTGLLEGILLSSLSNTPA
jgi:exopolyphosphatase/guanosine-5'-triphosphate,3'-diphosphate pyrophosphatase